MFVVNFKVNSNLILKIFLLILFVIVLIIVGISIYKLCNSDSNLSSFDNCSNYDNTYTLSTSNYTNVLKSVHENLDTYIGQRIIFSGYVYRVYDFDSSQFVLARDMIIDSNSQTLVVGFLCHYENADSFASGNWVTISGTISKGNYHGEIPIIEIDEIQQIDKPTDEYVYPPDQTYVPTISVL
jgi:uncharacterized membrane protein YcgQ (UPF0703/DUF1980 family)